MTHVQVREGLRLEEAELRLVRLPLKFRFETSFGVQTERLFPLLVLRAEGLEGYAEGVMDAGQPLYREETVEGATAMLRDQLLPRVLGKRFANPEALVDVLRPFRGNRMAKAALEMAFWDLWAKRLEQPLWAVLGGVRQEVPTGVSLGIQPSVDRTLELIEEHLVQGYRRIKLKIKPGWDLAPLRAARERFPDAQFTADANSAYSLTDAAHLASLDGCRLDYLEQPLAWDDLHDHAQLQTRLATPLCLDESVTSAADARKALQIGACRVVNIKVGRVGGHLEARRVHDVAEAFGAAVWCGGMLESGVGRAHNLHLSTLSNFTKPGDTSASSRYWHTDIVEERLEPHDGLMPVPEGPGIGVTLNRTFLESVTAHSEVIRP